MHPNAMYTIQLLRDCVKSTAFYMLFPLSKEAMPLIQLSLYLSLCGGGSGWVRG